MSKQSIVQVSLKANEELIKRTKQHQQRSFYMVGKERYTNLAEPGQKPDWQYKGIDFIDAFAAMSKREQAIVKLIKDCIKWSDRLNSYNYEVELSPDSVHFNTELLDTMHYSSFLKGFGLLFKKDLVRRTRKHHYMFNPDFFVYRGEQVAYFDNLWNQAKSYKD